VGQLLAHLVGDYILQTNKMARLKTGSWLWAIMHGLAYSLPFMLFRPSLAALAVIAGSHIVIDRFRLARYVIILKNKATDWTTDFNTATGYPESSPPWLSFWLLIITDNTIHLCINFAALRYLG
jgi:hypothetical protein